MSLAPFELNFSLTLNKFVSKTIWSLIISSGFLKSQSWAIIFNVVTNSSSVSDESSPGLDGGITGFPLGLT